MDIKCDNLNENACNKNESCKYYFYKDDYGEDEFCESICYSLDIKKCNENPLCYESYGECQPKTCDDDSNSFKNGSDERDKYCEKVCEADEEKDQCKGLYDLDKCKKKKHCKVVDLYNIPKCVAN